MVSSYLAFVIGLLSAIGKIGGACANFGLPFLVNWFQNNTPNESQVWKQIILFLSIIGMLLAGLVWIVGKNGPKDVFVPAISELNWKKIREEFLCIAKKRSIWILGLYGYSLYLTLSVFSDTFSIRFIELWLQVPTQQAGKLAVLVAIGSSCGAPLISFFSDIFKKRVFFLKLSVTCVLILSGLIFFGPQVSFWTAGFCLFFLDFFLEAKFLCL